MTQANSQEMTIILDKPANTIYHPGQSVTGKVYIKSKVETRTRGLYIKFEGKAQVRWTKQQQDSSTYGRDGQRVTQTITKYFDNFDSVFIFEKYLMGDGKREDKISGNASYPFGFKIPNGVPLSYEGAHGKIEYILVAHLARPFLKTDLEAKQRVTVDAIVDLNHIPGANEPGEWEASKSFCCLCCTNGPLSMIVRLPAKGYCPGEVILVEVEIINYSRRFVKDVCAELIDETKYKATNGTNESVTPILSTSKGEGVLQGEHQVWNTVIRIPPLPPTKLGGCRIIDLEYYLRVTVDIPGKFLVKAKKMVLECPIIIGTVPLRIRPSSTVSTDQPSVDTMTRKSLRQSTTADTILNALL